MAVFCKPKVVRSPLVTVGLHATVGFALAVHNVSIKPAQFLQSHFFEIADVATSPYLTDVTLFT